MIPRVLPFAALAAALGGLLLIIFAVLVSFKPLGCIGATCAIRSMREYDEYAPLLLASLLLMLFALVVLISRARARGRFGRLGLWGVSLLGSGMVVLLAATLVQELVYAGDFPHMPNVVIPGVLASAVGFLLLGIVMLRVLPRWVGSLLIVGAVLLPFSNDQDARVLLFIPLGLAWIAVGYALWRDGGHKHPNFMPQGS